MVKHCRDAGTMCSSDTGMMKCDEEECCNRDIQREKGERSRSEND